MEIPENSSGLQHGPPRMEKGTTLLRIASLLAILWATVLLLSSVALLIPLARMSTYKVPTALVAMLAVPGLLLLAAGIGVRLRNRMAMGATILICTLLTLLSIIQLSKGIPIALIGLALNPCIIALLIAYLFQTQKAEAKEGA
jgi:hypothetical protein